MSVLMNERGEKRDHLSSPVQNPITLMRNLVEMQVNYCDSILTDPSVMAVLQTADLIIGDSLYPCGTLIADMLSLPHINVIMSPDLSVPVSEMYGIPTSPMSYVPQMGTGLTADMGVFGRLKNIAFYTVSSFIRNFLFYPMYDELKASHKIKPSKTIRESLMSVELLLFAADFVLVHTKPLPPYVKEVGFFMPSPSKPLPAELDHFMRESGEKGVILVSFGTAINTLDPAVIEMMSKAFAQLPHKIIWRVYPGNYPKSVSDNVKLVEWVPQNDILGHNNTKLFINHGGANGMAETAYHGVPVVCSPFFADQPDNSNLLKNAGMGEIVRVNTATAEELVRVVTKVINDDSYKTNGARVSRAMKSRPREPVKEAADFVEYVLAQGHLPHLKPRSLAMPFYQVYMLDVMAVIGAVILVFIALIKTLVQLISRACSPKKLKSA
ncbi:UDP-glucuronosyltransferase 2A3 isoform X2 [Nematostella vectensis]|nr:UDP-glucuronosyltransferase 2A3 isoform X2 [Nematostella vectensis]